jgi:hypothetical protein
LYVSRSGRATARPLVAISVEMTLGNIADGLQLQKQIGWSAVADSTIAGGLVRIHTNTLFPVRRIG